MTEQFQPSASPDTHGPALTLRDPLDLFCMIFLDTLYNIPQPYDVEEVGMALPPVRITASEFRQNFGKYMKDVAHTDFEVTRNGRVVGLWTNPHRDQMKLVDELSGAISNVVITDEDAERLREERILRRAGFMPHHDGDEHLVSKD